MDLHRTVLPEVPEPIKPEDLLLSLEFNFGRTLADTHMQIHSAVPELSLDLVRFWEGYRSEGTEWLKGHPAYFRITLPHSPQSNINARLHVAVPFVNMEDLESEHTVEHREDFDRLMDLVKQALIEMVNTGLLPQGKHAVDIVAEPLNTQGKLRAHLIEDVSFAIGVSWLEQNGQQIFRDFRYWDPRKGDWEVIRE